jgi:uncharacterized protein YbjQ (UPF0145 family)
MQSFKCAVCKSGRVSFDEKGKKGSCDHCGSVYAPGQEEGIVLRKLTNKEYTEPFYEMRQKQNEVIGLQIHEWENLANGGMTDEEKRKAEKKKAAEEKERIIEDMIVTTTPGIFQSPVKEYKGIVTGQVAAGVSVFKDAFAGIRNIVGGRSDALQKTMAQMREEALKDIKSEAADRGANAVVGVTLDFDEYGEGMLLLTVTGTAVLI